MSVRGAGRLAGMMPGAARPVPAGARLPGPFAAARPVAGARARWREAAGVVVVFVVVAAVHAAGTGIVSDVNRVSASGEVLFPAAGVTVAALLLLPRRWWPVVLAAAFCSELAADLVLGETAVTSAGSAVAGAAGPAAGAGVFLAWAAEPLSLSRRRPLAAFVAGPAVIGAGVAALIGAAAALFMPPDGAFVTLLARWWTSGALGVLIVGGIVVAWLTETGWPVRPRYRVAEGCGLAVCAGALTWLAFWAWRPGLTYLCLVPLGWAAVRFGARGATTVAALMAVAGEWGTVTDHGLFAAISHDHSQALWLVQLFLAVAVLGGLVLASQVAELARAEAALRASERAEQQARLAAREAQAAERARLARDLHDSVSQALFSMSMHARTAQLALAQVPHSDGGPLARAVGQLRELAAGALAEMRALIFELRPDALAEEGLVAALTRQAAAISAREGLPVTVDGPADPLPLSPEAAEHSYRVALEALHNTVKHAAASHAAVLVEAGDGQRVRVSVTDDGAGFDPGPARPGHLGLRTMAERARAAGGDLELVTGLGAGTRVQLTVPAYSTAGKTGR
jgi:signal transduction histidine kinase